LFENLAKLASRYDDLSDLINNPTDLSYGAEYAKIAKEHGKIQSLALAYKSYAQSVSDLAEAKELAKTNPTDYESFVIELEKECENKVQEIKDLIVSDNPDADNPCIVEIRAGTGGEEASLFVRDLFTAYCRYAQKHKWKIEIIDAKDTGSGGIKEISFEVEGINCYNFMQWEAGGHRVQRVPATETQGRVHTSMCTVAVLLQVEPTEFEIKESDIEVDTFRASGAGGQHVNKTDSAIRLKHVPSGIVVECQQERSQHKNKAMAMKLLSAKLYDMQRQAEIEETNSKRNEQIGSGDRNEKIRTYNVPQNRCTDHRLGMNFSLEHILLGELDSLFQAVQEWVKEEKVKSI
jgi:peptide chain release factor 1